MTRSPQLSPPNSVAGGVSLAPYTTFRAGGAAEWFSAPRSTEELQEALVWATEAEIEKRFLGLGSNLLISDHGMPGLTISTRKLKSVAFMEDGKFWAAAGASIVKLSHSAAERGWSGWEWAVGVPGTVGGAVTMNAGAHGTETVESLVSVEILDETLQPQTLLPEDLEYAYRSSLLQKRPWIVTGATFQLSPDHSPESIIQQTQAFWKKRHSTQPYDWPSCGSVFRNPYPKAAGWLIEQTGLKGYQIGGAQVAEKHANFILNRERAKAQDIYHLIAYVREKVSDKWDILLHPEVHVWGQFDSADLPFAIHNR